MDCENLLQNSQLLNKNCSKISKKFGVESTENLIKLNSDIVFNNQTNKLLKQVVNCNSTTPVMGKYNLRKKSVQTRLDSIKKQQTDKLHIRGLVDDSKPKKRNSQLSRYKRKNANARERNRVQAINDAFERLRSKLPTNFIQQNCADKSITKIETLRIANTYIASLKRLLNEEEESIKMNQDVKMNQEVKINQEMKMNQEVKMNQELRMNKAVNDLNEAEIIEINSEDESVKLCSIDKDHLDTLPNISFIDELSSLSYISNEENQLPNATFNLISNSSSAESSLLMTNEENPNATFNLILNSSSDESCLLMTNEEIRCSNDTFSLNIQYEELSTKLNETNSINQTYPVNKTYVNINQSINNRMNPLGEHQSYSIQSPIFSDNFNAVQNNQQSINSLRSTASIESINLDLNSKNHLAVQDSNNNQTPTWNRFKNGLITSTPSNRYSDDSIFQSSLFSPIKCDNHFNQQTNYFSIKSARDDVALNCFDVIENNDILCTARGDKFDLIL